MKKFGVNFFVWFISSLPFPVMYLLSDFVYFLVYYVVGYRKKVVFDNLRNSFPEKSEHEIAKIAKQFYHHFFDVMFEVPKANKMTKADMGKRFRLKNPEILDAYYEQNRSVIFITGHYGNWEWLSYTLGQLKHKGYAVYLPLREKVIDDLMLRLRQKFGVTMISNENIIRTMMTNNRNNVCTATYFIADQSPHKAKIQYWTHILNQDTPMFVGVEKIAKKLNNPTFFLEIHKVKRGYYELELKLLHEKPKELKEYELTDMQIQTLEKVIKKEPQYWLWTHRRWKHKKENTPLQSDLVKKRNA